MFKFLFLLHTQLKLQAKNQSKIGMFLQKAHLCIALFAAYSITITSLKKKRSLIAMMPKKPWINLMSPMTALTSSMVTMTTQQRCHCQVARITMLVRSKPSLKIGSVNKGFCFDIDNNIHDRDYGRFRDYGLKKYFFSKG